MRKPRILVVDDEPTIRKFVRANLEARDYEILLASDGSEAISEIEKEMPDLIILDLVMPKMDGFEVCRQVREWSQIPIIILSARDGEMDKVKCLEMGADDYITKPFGVDELMARVKAVIRRIQTSKNSSFKQAYTYNELTVDFTKHLVTVEGRGCQSHGHRISHVILSGYECWPGNYRQPTSGTCLGRRIFGSRPSSCR